MLPCSLKLDAPSGWPLSPSRNWTKNVQLKPMKSSHADHAVSAGAEQPAEDLRPPVDEPAEQREQRRAPEQVVGMGDAERRPAPVAVVPEDRERERGEEADREEHDGAAGEQQRRRPADAAARLPERLLEQHERDDGGDRRDHGEDQQHDARLLADAARVGVVEHEDEREAADADERLRQRPRACDRAAGEHRHDLGQDPERPARARHRRTTGRTARSATASRSGRR